MQSIVADMRKVLAKNPLVEQRKLHRRVFLEDINPENQALMVDTFFLFIFYMIMNSIFFFIFSIGSERHL